MDRINKRMLEYCWLPFGICALLISGCDYRQDVEPTNLERFSLLVVRALSSRDAPAIEALVFPENITYFKDMQRMKSYREFVESRFASVPESNSSSVELSKVEVISDRNWYPSSRLIDAIPIDTIEPIEVAVYGTIDGETFSVGLAIGKMDQRYFLLIPDVTELWRIELVE